MVILKYGVVSDVQPGYARVKFEDDDFVTDWLPVLVRKSKTDKENWPFEVNEHVACLMAVEENDNCDTGVIIGALVSDEDQPDGGEYVGKFRMLFSDGSLLQYDKNAHKYTIDIKGGVDITASQKVLVKAAEIECEASTSAKVKAPQIECDASAKATIKAPVISLEGNVVVSGTLAAAGITSTGGNAIQSTGDISTSGEITGNDVKAGGISLKTHRHAGVQSGSGVTGPAQ